VWRREELPYRGRRSNQEQKGRGHGEQRNRDGRLFSQGLIKGLDFTLRLLRCHGRILSREGRD
jgi:hypothetical protein